MGKSNRVDSVNLVYNDLKNRIIAKEKLPDEKLPELQLCEQYGISRLYVKEALKMLEMENLVRYVPRRGYHVVGISLSTIQEIALLRFSNDYIAATYFAEYASAAALEQAAKTVDRAIFFSKYQRIEDAIAESKVFYQQVYQFCPFTRVKNFLSDIESYLEIIRRYDRTKEGYNLRASAALEQIITGIQEKDAQKIKSGLYARDSMILDALYHDVAF